MSLVFPDVNVWLVLTITHVHQSSALDWWRRETNSIAFCRLTQIGLLRLLTTSAVMDGRPLTVKQAWSAYDVLAGDERVEFVQEPPSLERAFRDLTSRTHTAPKLWADAYLAAFAAEHNATLVTFDQSQARRSPHSKLLK